jgi:hypothetical protein
MEFPPESSNLLFGGLYDSLIFNLCRLYDRSNQISLASVNVVRLRGSKFMSIQEVSAERFAQLFHQYQQALANDCGSASTCAKDAWSNVPAPEKNLMIAAARLALLEVELLPSERQLRRYFAKPGEAEWGC